VPNDISTIQLVPFTSPPTLSIDTVHISTTKLETNRTPRPCDNHRRMVKLKRGGNDKCYGLASWYRYASDNFYFPRSYFNDISLLQPGQALRHWMLNTAYCLQWHRWRSASCIKITMSLNHFRIRLFTTEDGYVPGEERIYRRQAREIVIGIW